MKIKDITHEDCQVQFFINSFAPTEEEPDMWIGSGWYDSGNDEIIPDDGDSYGLGVDYAIWRNGDLWVWESAAWTTAEGEMPFDKDEWLRCMEVCYGPSLTEI